MSKSAKQIRKEIGDLGFDYGIRLFSDGERWAFSKSGLKTTQAKQSPIIFNKLIEIGYKPWMEGKPYTEGEFIINF